ncbi:MAG: reverse gyrase [Candidatus Caldatribacterium sp.]|nr:reverse gyrase [Candidatus Caldatribacterium sp.]
MELAIFRNLCPNCGERISAERLEKGLACEKCLPEEPETGDKTSLCELLQKRGKLQGYQWVCNLRRTEKAFEEFFCQVLGFEPWSLQRAWARRVFLGESFSLIAPTGVGKTTFGIAMAHFLPGSAYIIVPTRVLVEQVIERSKAFGNKKVVGYLGRAKERRAIELQDYEVLVTTNMFLSTSFNLLKGKRFDFVFVDDVDSLVKSGRNVDKVLQLLGFSEEEIRTAWEQVAKRISGAPQGGKEEETGEIPRDFGERREPGPHYKGVLVVSSATLRPKTKRVALFRALLGFEIVPAQVTIRNICDAVQWASDPNDAKRKLVYWIKRFGKGGLVFVPRELGQDGIAEIIDCLQNEGINAAPYNDLDLDAFQRGEVEVAVGKAHATSSLVRGVDLPETIRYAIFLDVPKMTFPVAVNNPHNFTGLLFALREISDDTARIDAYLSIMRQYRHIHPDQPLPKRMQEIADYLNQEFGKETTLGKLEASETVGLCQRNGQFFITLGDAATYLQGSGRTSRLFPGGISRGLSLIIAWDKKAFNSLVRRLKLFHDEVTFVDAEQVDWKAELEKVDRDREHIRAVLQAKGIAANLKPKEKTLARPEIETTLVIVESPNKARTIAQFFGTPQQRIVDGLSTWEVATGDRLLAVTASLGHVFDLVEDEGIYGVLEVNGTFLPVYGSIKLCPQCGEQTTRDVCSCGKPPERDKLALIKALQRIATQFDEIVIATDPDAEGEKIGYDLLVALKPFNSRILRAEFHEVTRRAFLEALQSPRGIEHNLVKAQMTRRILDRWVGFELSQKLWHAFNRYDLSAGRVQTPVLGWVIERTELSRRKKARITVHLLEPETQLQTKLDFEEDDIPLARKLFEQLERAKVSVTELGEEMLDPPPPYHTGTLLAEAGSFAPLGTVMNVLQDLFERGLITYHRTDSIRVGDAGLRVAEELLKGHYDQSLFQPRRYGTEGAHECIRPTRPLTENDLRFWLSIGRIALGNPKLALRLYGMIVRRFLASQMKPARVRRAKVTLNLDGWQKEWKITTEVFEEGFSIVLPLQVQKVSPNAKIVDKQIRFISKVPPFTQGSLIEKMRQHGLGRPSTYAKIVQTLLERGYIVERNGFLFATKLGKKAHQWLRSNFPEFTDEALTRDLEEKSDGIEAGSIDYQAILWEIRRSRLFSS